MKENSIEKLQERLETLHVIQDARLACNADDLDIREEIAEVEEEIKELQDDTNVNRENSIKNERSSIEKAVKTMEHWVEYEKNNKDKINKADELIYIQETVLSGYKRILKENELLRKDIEGWKKYCEEIEEEQTEMSNKNCELEFEIEKLQKENEIYKKNSEIMSKENLSTAEQLKVKIKENFRLKNQLENNRKEYQETYKDVREELKELKKENEKLKNIRYDTPYGTETIHLIPESNLIEINIQKYMIEVESGKFVDLKQVYLENKKLNEYKENYISIQKIKDKIKILEKLQNEFLNNEELRVKIIAYKELIKEREEK